MIRASGRWGLAIVLAAAVSGAARRRAALSDSGAGAAVAVGTAVFGAGRTRGSVLLLLFFGSSTALSRLAGVPAAGVKGPRRTAAQVLANGGLPALLAIDHALRPSPRRAAAYAGALAAANGDTWATEIGRLSRATPRMITTGRRAAAGVSGAITPLGTLASLAGAMLVGATDALTRRGTAAARSRHALSIAVAGFAGALADSLLGATAQQVFVCSACNLRTENPAHRHGDARPALRRVQGLPLVGNDTVNLCASLTGAALGAALSDPR